MRGGRRVRPVMQYRAGNGIIQTKTSQEKIKGKHQSSKRKNAAPQRDAAPQQDVLDDAAVSALIRIDSRSAPGGKEAKRMKSTILEGEERKGEESEQKEQEKEQEKKAMKKEQEKKAKEKETKNKKTKQNKKKTTTTK